VRVGPAADTRWLPADVADSVRPGEVRSGFVRTETHYAGAIYGSLLAAAVVVGASADGTPLEPMDLGVGVLGTGVIFWAAHVYARVVGERPRSNSRRPAGGSRPGTGVAEPSPDPVTARRVYDVARGEWPMVQAALPPSVVALAGGLVGVPAAVVTVTVLGIAVVSQVGWAMVAANAAGIRRWGVVASGAGNLVLGLLIVVLEVTLH
jgi:hypothetical protein